MQFDLDEDRALIQQSARELLEKESPLAEGRAVMEDTAEGYSKALYAQLAELGYLGLSVPEESGGTGMGATGLAAVLEELGRVAFPGPFLDLIVAAEALRAAGGGEARDALRRLLAGEALVVVADREALSGDEPAVPSARFEAGRVVGTKRFVPFGALADALLVTTSSGLALVPRPDPGWDATPLETLDHAQRFAEITLDAPGVLVSTAGDALDSANRLASLGAAALLTSSDWCSTYPVCPWRTPRRSGRSIRNEPR